MSVSICTGTIRTNSHLYSGPYSFYTKYVTGALYWWDSSLNNILSCHPYKQFWTLS